MLSAAGAPSTNFRTAKQWTQHWILPNICPVVSGFTFNTVAVPWRELIVKFFRIIVPSLHLIRRMRFRKIVDRPLRIGSGSHAFYLTTRVSRNDIVFCSLQIILTDFSTSKSTRRQRKLPSSEFKHTDCSKNNKTLHENNIVDCRAQCTSLFKVEK